MEAKSFKSSQRTVGKTKGNPVQVHGEIWENEIKAIYGVSAGDNIVYTEAHDIPKHLNRKQPGRNVSVKTTGNNTVCFGDANRIYQTIKRSSPLDVVVVKYTQTGDTKNVRQVERYNFDHVGMNLFGNDSHRIENDLQLLHGMLQRGDSGYKDLKKSIQQRITDSGGYVTLNPKIGNPIKHRHGRLQMSISGGNWEKLISEHPDILVAQEECGIFGCPIQKTIQSSRRVLHKKTSVARGINRKNKTRKTLKSSKTMKIAKKMLETI